MLRKSNIEPPEDFTSYTPSQLFRFFFQVGRWTEESFSSDFQSYTRGKLISTVSINKWKNHDVIPTRYSGHLFKLIEDQFENKVAKKWISAFEIVWATHSAKSHNYKDNSDTRLSSEIICNLHREWILSLYDDHIFGETFAPKDIYVPIQLIQNSNDGSACLSNTDLLSNLIPTESSDRAPNWTFITGDAGSGKSILAIHLAQAITKTDIMPIYLRGRYLSDIDIDVENDSQPVIDSFSVRSFLKHFRASSKQVACLLLDGVEEISGGSTSEAIAVFQQLKLEQNICLAHGKTLQIIAFSRSIEKEIALLFFSNARQLRIIGLDGSFKHLNGVTENLAGPDMRTLWWKKYLKVSELQSDPTLPDFLSTHFDDFSEFGSNPFFSLLICQTAFKRNHNSQLLPHEIVNEYTNSKDINSTYESLIDSLYLHSASKNVRILNKSDFVLALQREALNQWQLGTDENVYFSLYLVGQLIISCFMDIINAAENKERLENALEKWANISGAGKHNPRLAELCQKEVSLRYDLIPESKWDAALKITKHSLKFRSSAETGISTICHMQKSASLLFFIWSCFNIERQKRSGEAYELPTKSNDFDIRDFRYIQPSNFLNIATGDLLESRLDTFTFISFSLSATKLAAGDLSQISFSPGHLQSFNSEKSSFALTHWSHVKITDSEFAKAGFQHAIIHGCRWINTGFLSCIFQATKIQNSSFANCRFTNIIFSQCYFSDVDFLRSEFSGAIFDKCTFSNCSFEEPESSQGMDGGLFRHCTFLSMQRSLQKIPKENMEHCVIQSRSNRNFGSKNSSRLEGEVGNILN